MWEKFRKFMLTRNGTDSIFYACLVIYLILFGFNMLFRNIFIYYTELIIVAFALIRYFMKDNEKHRKQTEKFNKILLKIFPNGKLLKRRLLESRDYCFHECKNCGAILRFERRRGKFNVTCPKCKHKMTIRNWL